MYFQLNDINKLSKWEGVFYFLLRQLFSMCSYKAKYTGTQCIFATGMINKMINS